MISTMDLATATGLFEGEGSVRITKPAARNWGSLLVSLVNTDREIVEFFQARWSGYMRPATGMRANQRPAFVWQRAALDAAAFLEAVQPYAVTARMKERIRHGLDFQSQKQGGRGCRSEDYREAQWTAYWWMAELNKRGVTCEHRRAR